MMTDLSEPKIINHVFRMVLFGSIALWLFNLSGRFDDTWKYVPLLPGWLMAAGALRNLHALFIFPKLILTPQEIELRYWQDNSSWLGVFLPFNRIVNATIPWSQFERCVIMRITEGADWFANRTFLYIVTSPKTHQIGGDVFARDTSELMRLIGQYYDSIGDDTEPTTENDQTFPLIESLGGEKFRQPSRSQSSHFNSLRFATPVTFQSTVVEPGVGTIFEIGCAVFLFPFLCLMFGAIGCLVMIGLSALLLISGQGELSKPFFEEVNLFGFKAPLFLLIGGPLGAVVGIASVIWFTIQDSRKKKTSRILTLRADGFGLGVHEDDVQIIPWDEVLRAQVKLTQTTSTGDFGSYTTTTTYVEIDLRNRDSLRLGDGFGRTCEDLAELIDPPKQKLEATKALMDSGMPIEEAAMAAGLSPAQLQTSQPDS